MFCLFVCFVFKANTYFLSIFCFTLMEYVAIETV